MAALLLAPALPPMLEAPAMITVDSQALVWANKALGLSGASSSGKTEFLDGQVDQGLDVAPIVRRSRTLAQSQGLFFAIVRNLHLAASTETTTVLPYALSVIQTQGGGAPSWPVPVPDTFDLWLLAAQIIQSSGTGTLSATLRMQYADRNQAWGFDSNNNSILGAVPFILAEWNALVSQGGITFGLLRDPAIPLARINQRLPRDASTELVFSSTSSAVTNFDFRILLGLFPVALGQDATF